MAVIKLKLPTRELGVIVEKAALGGESGLRDKIKDEFDRMSKSLYDKANGGVVGVVSGAFRDSFFDERIDTKNKYGMTIGFDFSIAPHGKFILGGTVFMPPRDIVEMTNVEFDVPNNIRSIIRNYFTLENVPESERLF